MRTMGLSVVLCQQRWGCRGAGWRERMGCADTRQTHATWGCWGCCFPALGAAAQIHSAQQQRCPARLAGTRSRGTAEAAALEPQASCAPGCAVPPRSGTSTGRRQCQAGRRKLSRPCWRFLSPRY